MAADFRMLRSWMFVPGDSERKLARAWEAGADALILDLEDSVMPQNKADARGIASAALATARGRDGGPAVFIRINALSTGLAEADIAGTIAARPDGYVLPKVADGSDVRRAAAILAAAERDAGLPARSVALLPIATELPQALFHLPDIAGGDPRVAGLLWGMEDLSTEIGARRTRGPDGRILDIFRTARALALFAGAGAAIAVVDTPHVDIADMDGLVREAEDSSWSGFTGKLAIHPSQVAAINAAFTPSEAEVEEARTILRLSEEGGGAAFRHAGRMVDTPHLEAARRLLKRLHA